MGLTLGHREDARAEELHNLRLALATFALQLDAFEMRASGALLAIVATVAGMPNLSRTSMSSVIFSERRSSSA